MVSVYVDNEIHPEPLGDFMLDYLHSHLTEWANVDYKLTIDISHDSGFVKIAEDVFAMGNWGGGWLLFGYEQLPNRTIIPRGLDDRFNVDQAVLQQRFSAYCTEEVALPFRTFERIVTENGQSQERLFAAVFVPPSVRILKPKKDGWFTDPRTMSKKEVFKKGDIKTRRGTRTVTANASEVDGITKRINEEQHRLSLLSGRADNVQEVILGNLLRVLRIPDCVRRSEMTTDDFPFSEIGPRPFVKEGKKVWSFCRLSEGPLSDYLDPHLHVEVPTDDLMSDPDGQRLLIYLLNLEIVSAMRTRQLTLDPRSKALFFECQDDVRIESWGMPGQGKPRKVAVRKHVKKINADRWRHYSVKLRFLLIHKKLYLRVEPSIVLTTDGKRCVHDFDEGTLLTPLLRRRYNRTYYLDLHFWLSFMPRKAIDDDTICLNGRIDISPQYWRSQMTHGISFDRLAKEQIETAAQANTLQSTYIEEPNLVFGGHKEESDPRLGLKYFGPFHAVDEEPMKQVTVGVIATGNTLDLARRILEMLGSPQRRASGNGFLFPDFPGFSIASVIGCEFTTSRPWQEAISNREMEAILSKAQDAPRKNINERIAKAVKLYVDRVRSISLEDNRPDVILCIVPNELNKYCGISEITRGAKKRARAKMERNLAEEAEAVQTTLIQHGVEDPLPKNFDLRNAVKGKVMEYGIPVQFLLEENAEAVLQYVPPSIVQDPATFSWNLGTAMYYKANGKPWRLAKLDEGTCYVGVSFYKSRLEPSSSIQASMAQVFTHSGDGFVLRGGEVVVDERAKEPHLPESKAFGLLHDAIEQYSAKVHTEPSRVVVHKTSWFTREERKGFVDAIGDASADLVGIGVEPEIRFVRTGRYPVLRGTLIKLAENDYLLYTSGFIPRLRTYPGHRIPMPLHLDLDCDSEPVDVAREILKLTKINWNTAAFCDKLPITLVFPRQVGKVLSELPEGSKIQSHYRFYM